MRPSASLWVRAHDDENPSAAGLEAVAQQALPSRPTSSSVAAARVAASPITTRRMAEWPTMNPALIAEPALDGVEVLRGGRPVPGHAGSEGSSGMPSTRASMRIR